MDVLITTICSTTSYTTGTAAFVSSLSRVLSAGSSLSSGLVNIPSDATISPVSLNQYNYFLQAYMGPMYSLNTISNADAANAVLVQAQLVSILQALVETSATHVYPSAFAGYFSVWQSLVNYANLGFIRRSAMISCDKWNSLNSIGSQVSSEFSVLQHQAWLSSFFTQTFSGSLSSVTCPPLCVTSTTIISATSTTEMTTSTIESTASITSEATTTDATTTNTANTDTRTDKTGVTTSKTLETSSRTVSGSIQRCLVRPTSTALASSPESSTSSDSTSGTITSTFDAAATSTEDLDLSDLMTMTTATPV